MKHTKLYTRGMRGLCILLMGIGWSFQAQAADESITVSAGGVEIVELPFMVEGYTVVNRSVITATELPGGRKLQISGQALGSTDLLVTGAGQERVYRITVVENINDVLVAMMRDLDTVPEVELTVNLGRIMVKGEVNSIANWELLQKVISVYENKVVNLATFRPAPEVMAQLTDSLRKNGFEIAKEGEELTPGKVQVKWSGNTLFISSRFYAASQVGKLTSVVKSHPWLLVVDNLGEAKGNDPRVQAVLNLEMEPTMLEVDVAFVGVSDSDYKQIGVNLAKAGLIAIDTTSAAFQGTIGKNRSSGFGGSYSINSGLQGSLNFFTGGGPGRFVQRAHMTFRNDTPEWKTYQSGGTLKVRVATKDQIGIEDINYGLIMRVKGGLQDEEHASLDLNLELSYPQPVGADYDLKRNTISTSVNCPLGYTLVLGGMKGLVEQSSSDGVPFLRSVPVVSWLFSEKKSMKEDTQVLIMVSPYLATAPEQRDSAPLSEEGLKVEQDAQKSIKTLEKQKRSHKWFFDR